jgi:transcription elongation GreA/GreB family factor
MAMPPVWSHKAEAHTGDTIYLWRDKHIRSFILSAFDEAEPETGRIPVTSPIGNALLGRHRGDTVRLATLGGELDYTILKII